MTEWPTRSDSAVEDTLSDVDRTLLLRDFVDMLVADISFHVRDGNLAGLQLDTTKVGAIFAAIRSLAAP